MQELKKGDLVNLTNGSQAKIIEELGRGGHGEAAYIHLLNYAYDR